MLGRWITNGFKMAGRAPWLVLIAAFPTDWLALAAGVDDVICSWLRMLKLTLVVRL